MVTTIPQIENLAEAISNDLAGGGTSRQTFGAKDQAFAWTTGLPSVLAKFVQTAQTESNSFVAVRISPSVTPVGKVAEGGVKPTAVTLTTADVVLSKYAGLASYSTERAMNTAALLPAIYATLVSGALLSYDADAIAVLAVDHIPEVTGATWASAILAGIAAVIGNGGNPDLLVMSGSDYAAAVESPGNGYLLDPRDGVPSLFGLRICVSAGAIAGTAYVADSAAILCVESVYSPIVIVDPFSGLATNQIRMAAELFATTLVTAPASVAELTVVP